MEQIRRRRPMTQDPGAVYRPRKGQKLPQSKEVKWTLKRTGHPGIVVSESGQRRFARRLSRPDAGF